MLTLHNIFVLNNTIIAIYDIDTQQRAFFSARCTTCAVVIKLGVFMDKGVSFDASLEVFGLESLVVV